VLEEGMIAENVTKVVGELGLEVASSVTVDQLTAAIAKAFAVDPQHVLVFLQSGSKRRLTDAARRFLSSSFLVEYEVTVPANSIKDVFLNAAKTLADQASVAGIAFTSMLETSGVKVFKVYDVLGVAGVVQEAVLADAVVIRDSKGSIVKFSDASATTSEGRASGLTKEELVGVIAAGTVALMVIIWIFRMLHCCHQDPDADTISDCQIQIVRFSECCHLAAKRLHCCCKKDCTSSKQESPDANGMSHSLSENRH